MPTRHMVIAAIGLALVLVAGCGRFEPPTATPLPPSATRTATATATLAPTATATPTTTATPTATTTPTNTPTATATPTALPVTISGDPRGMLASAPLPQSGAPCGIVDVLDFPLDPPDGKGAYGGQDLGSYRSRYGLYHAGEDWRGPSRQASFGTPVYSIGHGVVTYAEPLGWGADQGTVIVRHTFSDGKSILSFYGHLDPSSVVLDVGDCVARGDFLCRRPPGAGTHAGGR